MWAVWGGVGPCGLSVVVLGHVGDVRQRWYNYDSTKILQIPALVPVEIVLLSMDTRKLLIYARLEESFGLSVN